MAHSAPGVKPAIAVAAETDCPYDMVAHVASYILIIGIMAGMLLWGFIGDITGRKWGSRCVSAIMLSGCILLTFSAYARKPSLTECLPARLCLLIFHDPWLALAAATAYGYFAYYVTAQTWYGE